MHGLVEILADLVAHRTIVRVEINLVDLVGQLVLSTRIDRAQLFHVDPEAQEAVTAVVFEIFEKVLLAFARSQYRFNRYYLLFFSIDSFSHSTFTFQKASVFFCCCLIYLSILELVLKTKIVGLLIVEHGAGRFGQSGRIVETIHASLAQQLGVSQLFDINLKVPRPQRVAFRRTTPAVFIPTPCCSSS